MTIGERIKQRRLELNMSQDELAQKVGYKSRSSINKIELSRDLPLNKVEKMAKALDTTPGYLMGWQDKVGFYLDLPIDNEEVRESDPKDLYSRFQEANSAYFVPDQTIDSDEELRKLQLYAAYQKEIALLPYRAMIEKPYIQELLDEVKDYDEEQITKLIEWIAAMKRR